MSNFDWNRYLLQHPVFSDLSNEEIAPLLDERISIEKVVDKDQSIVKEGDQDQSIYLIGQGTANVFLKGPNDQDVFLNSMGKGDLIGEMALFEQKKRSATVIATETCTLLEFDGREFIKLLQVHPEIGFKLLVKLSERLRDLGDHVLNEKLRGVDEKIKHVNAKLDTEIKIIDASLKATQTVFDQTSKRAHEVIESADRSRSRFTITASTLGTIFTILFSVLGYMGYDKLESVSEIKSNVEDDVHEFKKKLVVDSDELTAEMEKFRLKASGHRDAARKIRESIEKKSELIEQILSKQDVEQVFSKLTDSDRQIRKFLKRSLVTQFLIEIGLDPKKAKETYDFALSFKDDDVSDALYRQIVKEILNSTPPIRRNYAKILRPGIDNPSNTLSERQKTLSFYLLLATFILNEDDSQYKKYFEKFKAALVDIHDPGKETAEVYFGASVFKEAINNDTESTDEVQQAKIDKFNAIWGLIP